MKIRAGKGQGGKMDKSKKYFDLDFVGKISLLNLKRIHSASLPDFAIV